MLSMVATRRRAERRSGAKLPRARHAPLSSSISAMAERMAGVMRSDWVRIMPISIPNYTRFGHRHFYTQLHPLQAAVMV